MQTSPEASSNTAHCAVTSAWHVLNHPIRFILTSPDRLVADGAWPSVRVLNVSSLHPSWWLYSFQSKNVQSHLQPLTSEGRERVHHHCRHRRHRRHLFHQLLTAPAAPHPPHPYTWHSQWRDHKRATVAVRSSLSDVTGYRLLRPRATVTTKRSRSDRKQSDFHTHTHARARSRYRVESS